MFCQNRFAATSRKARTTDATKRTGVEICAVSADAGISALTRDNTATSTMVSGAPLKVKGGFAGV
jgi:hypothetical protein